MRRRLNPSPPTFNSPAKCSNSAWYSWSSLTIWHKTRRFLCWVIAFMIFLWSQQISNLQPWIIGRKRYHNSPSLLKAPALQLDISVAHLWKMCRNTILYPCSLKWALLPLHTSELCQDTKWISCWDLDMCIRLRLLRPHLFCQKLSAAFRPIQTSPPSVWGRW